MESDELERRSKELARDQDDLQKKVSPTPHLQAGEDPETAFADDAEHWVRVYQELAQFKQELLRRLREHIVLSREEAAAAELRRDERVWHLELQRIVLHLDYWRERERVLARER
ncbi:MAG: hypothetical protein WAM30_12800 [Candidatus Dormiibacterota bacterium]